MQEELQRTQRELDEARLKMARSEVDTWLERSQNVEGIAVLATTVEDANHDTLGHMADRFRESNPSSVVVLGSAGNGNANLVAAVSDDLVQRGLHAGKLLGAVARMVGGNGGGRATFAKGGGSEADKLTDALAKVPDLIAESLDK